MATRPRTDTLLTVTARLALPGVSGPPPSHSTTTLPRVMSTPAAALCRRRTLKVINSRPVLIAICTFVVIECACVLAELMVDLQGIKFRFENEEKELNRFVEFLKDKYPEEFATWNDASSVNDVVDKIKDSLVLRAAKDPSCPCHCPPQDQGGGPNPQTGGGARAGEPVPSSENVHKDSTLPASRRNASAGAVALAPFNPADVFVLEINNVKESFFLVAEYLPEHTKLNDSKHQHFETEYDRIHKASTALHITSLVILSFMVLETISKFVCMGTAFLKKKFEVFDAFIVISSFALDFVFLDSRWYETGKDAATILVLLLPWRVVRIVNSFLMTVKHKHHIEMMTIKRAKKRADFKNAKLQTLLTEIRKDVQLLVALCRNSHLSEADITSCLYGLGRRSTTLNAVTSCTTIMLVSALGKDASLEDEIYGKLFADALRDPNEHDSEPEAKKAEEEAIDAAIELDKQLEQQNKKAARAATKPPRLLISSSSRSKRGRGQVTRSYTVPRRSASIDHNLESTVTTASADADAATTADNNGSIFYVNDAFATHRASCRDRKRSGVVVSSAETLAGLAGGPSGCLPVAEEESREDGEETGVAGGSGGDAGGGGGGGDGGGGGGGAKDSWEGRLPPKCKSKASVRSLPGPGPGQNYVTFEVTTQVTYL